MTISRKRIAIWALLLVAALLAYAWIDGGEEPVRPISQPIALPDVAAEAAQ